MKYICERSVSCLLMALVFILQKICTSILAETLHHDVIAGVFLTYIDQVSWKVCVQLQKI